MRRTACFDELPFRSVTHRCARFGALSAAALAVLSFGATAHAAPETPALGVLLRSDLSLGLGGYQLAVDGTDNVRYDSAAGALGPRLALNLGYAPSQLIRLGLGASADFELNAFEHQGIPSTEIDGWLRWTAGPTIGFRFGPKLPLELELGVAFTQAMVIGSQASIGDGMGTNYSIGDKQYGTLQSALLLYRPGGPTSLFALHAGLTGGWAYGNNAGSDAILLTSSLLAGASLGL